MNAISMTTATRNSLIYRVFSRQLLIWALQGLLAVVFLGHGLLFLNPPPDIAPLMNAMLPRWFQLFLGVAEVLASVGLTLPAITGIQPRLVVWATAGTMIVLSSATVLHLLRGENSSAIVTVVLLAMATAVARARYQGLRTF
jgi:hypothetical protein